MLLKIQSKWRKEKIDHKEHSRKKNGKWHTNQQSTPLLRHSLNRVQMKVFFCMQKMANISLSET